MAYIGRGQIEYRRERRRAKVEGLDAVSERIADVLAVTSEVKVDGVAMGAVVAEALRAIRRRSPVREGNHPA